MYMHAHAYDNKMYMHEYIYPYTDLSQLKIFKGRTIFCSMHIVKKYKTSNQNRMVMLTK